MNIWPFGKHKHEIRADTDVQSGQIIDSDVLLNALIGRGTITKEKVLEIPAVQACISLIAGTISSLPVKLYREDESGRVTEIKDDHRIFLLNHDTGDTLTATQFWRAMLTDYFVGRGGYAYINRQGLDIRSIHYVREEDVSIVHNADPIFKQYDILVQGMRYHPYQFLKILRKSRTGYDSLTIMDENPTLIDVCYNSLIYERNLVRKGGNKKGFLQSEKPLSQEAMDALRTGFKRLYNNAEENVVVLNSGMKFQESSNTSVEMQLNENKRSNDEEISRLFGIPAAMLAGGATDQDYDSFIRTCAAIMNDIECSLDRDLLLESEKQNCYWAFDTRELTRGNIRERYEAYKIGLEKNFLQIDEVREKEDMEPIGFDWITLGLDQVLFNPKTGQIYTPNTNAIQNMGDMQAAPGGQNTPDDSKTDGEGSDPAAEERGYIGRNLIVAGPPGSGKSTWVHEHLQPGEIVWDFDEIRATLENSDVIHAKNDEIVPLMGMLRDTLFQAISDRKLPGKCYIITAKPNIERLTQWMDELNADLKVMDTPMEVCMERVKDDDTRPDKEIYYTLIKEWFTVWNGGEKT